METSKKVIGYILVAVIFALGGFFLGKGNLENTSASIYGATSAQKMKDPNISSTGPTGGDGGPAGLVSFLWVDGKGCHMIVNGQFAGVLPNVSRKDCNAIKVNPSVNTSASIYAATSAQKMKDPISTTGSTQLQVVWVDGAGCGIYNGDRLVAYLPNLSKSDCHAVKANPPVNSTR